MHTMGDEELAKLLLEKEEALLDPEIRRSMTSLDKLLATEFVEFGSSGTRYDKQAVINLLVSATENESLSLTDFTLLARTNEFAVVTYVCECHDHEGNLLRSSLRSSLWKSLEGRWQLAFHQGTRSEENQ